ncbi:MAG: site-2 protease family protein [Erythrobacter sp.]|nr:site-2 protease family protein [Erythrobacter sp.]
MLDTVTLAIILIPCLIVAIVFHEVAHGYAAKLLGDETASERGRLTLNPIAHVDPIGTLLVPGALLLMGGPAFGWAKPVPVNKWRLSNPRYGMMAVAAAGPGINFILAGVGAILLGLTTAAIGLPATEEPNLILTALLMFILLNIFLALFNLLPIPPFDGSHIVGGLLPRSMRAQWEKLQQVGIFLLIAIIAGSWAFGTGWIEKIVMPPVDWAMGYYLALASFVGGV